MMTNISSAPEMVTVIPKPCFVIHSYTRHYRFCMHFHRIRLESYVIMQNNMHITSGKRLIIDKDCVKNKRYIWDDDNADFHLNLNSLFKCLKYEDG